jgi:hypothetical protein
MEMPAEGFRRHVHWTKRIGPKDKVLGAGHRNSDALELGLRPDRHRLLVAARRQRDARGESGRRRGDVKNAAAGVSLDGPVDVPAGFAPGPGNRGPLCREVGDDIEFVAVAGAGQALLQAITASAHGVRCPTANSFGRPVVQRDGAGARPVPRHAGERSRLRVARGTEHGSREQGDDSEYQPTRNREGSGRLTSFFASLIAVRLPNDRYTVRLQMLHSTSPVRHCH